MRRLPSTPAVRSVRTVRRSVTVAAAVAGLVVAAAPAALAHVTPAEVAGSRPAATQDGTAAAAGVVELPTGDWVHVNDVDGKTVVRTAAAQPHGMTGSFLSATQNGDNYVFPGEARPFLGSVLDPSLFDVTALAKAPAGTRLPVTATFAHGDAADVPGLTITSRQGASARGYLDASSASTFRAGLSAAAKAALTPGAAQPHSLFGGLTHLALVGAATQVTPDYPQVTIVLHVLDDQGKPADGFVGLINTDDGRRFAGFTEAVDGIARLSVPKGHYGGITDVSSFGKGTFTDRLVPLVDFTVTANEQNFTFDASLATARVSVAVPKPIDDDTATTTAEYDRIPAGVGSLGDSVSDEGGGSALYVAPSGAPKVGTQDWLTSFSLTSPAAASPSYGYDLSFLDSNVISADQHNRVAQSQVAKLDEKFYSPQKRNYLFGREAIYPFQFVVFGFLNPLPAPLSRTDYIYGPPPAEWFAGALPAGFNGPYFEDVEDEAQAYPIGSVQSENWLGGPLAPGPVAQGGADSTFYCVTCRTDSHLLVDTPEITDTTGTHSGFVYKNAADTPSLASYALDQDGVIVDHGSGAVGGRFRVPATAATYALHAKTRLPGALLSNRTETTWTFPSAAGEGATPPAGWLCDFVGSSDCKVVSLLQAHVPLPTSLSDRLPIGTSTFPLSVSTIQGAATTKVTAVTLEVSADGGKTFTAAKLVKTGNGTYDATIDNPAKTAGQRVTIRVSAQDAAGDSLVQTTDNAYYVAK